MYCTGVYILRDGASYALAGRVAAAGGSFRAKRRRANGRRTGSYGRLMGIGQRRYDVTGQDWGRGGAEAGAGVRVGSADHASKAPSGRWIRQMRRASKPNGQPFKGVRSGSRACRTVVRWVCRTTVARIERLRFLCSPATRRVSG